MSKKKKKFKKDKRPSNFVTEVSQATDTTTPSPVHTTLKEEVKLDAETLDKYAYVQKDIKKIGIIIILIAVLIGVSYYLNEAGTLKGLGDWLYKIAGIQA